jgi:hypothetical protein
MSLEQVSYGARRRTSFGLDLAALIGRDSLLLSDFLVY